MEAGHGQGIGKMIPRKYSMMKAKALCDIWTNQIFNARVRNKILDRSLQYINNDILGVLLL